MKFKLIVTLLLLFCQMVIFNKIHKRKSKYLEFPNFYPPVHSCQCGIPNRPKQDDQQRIIGGTEIEPHAFPWLASVQFRNVFMCAASIVSDRYVVTAAHCLPPRFISERLKVIVGQHDRCALSNTTVILSVNRVIRHEDYMDQIFFADIMLLRLSMRLSFNRFIRPICLPFYERSLSVVPKYVGRTGVVVGWGRTNASLPDLSCTPIQLSVPILSKNECSAAASSLFCAGFVDGEQDSCGGDSGGPLQYSFYRRRYELIGIVSSGVGCALPSYPGQYTDVIRFLPWIWGNIEDSNFCW